MGDGDYLLNADAWVLGMLLRKLAYIQGSAPMDSHSPFCVPSPAGSTGSIGSRASLPPGGHIPCTHSETPPWTREQSSSSSSCSHRSNYDTDGHESEGSSGPSGGQSDIEQHDKANKSVSDHLGGEESDGNAEERDKSGQQDNAQEADESSGNETCSETESSEGPAGEVAQSAIIEMDSEDSESSSDSDSGETMPSVPTPKREGKEAKPSMAHSSSLPFLDPKLPEEQRKIEWHKYTRPLDINFGNWQDKKIQEGCKVWKTCSVMTCEHGDPGKEIKRKDPTGPLVDYMVNCNVFKVKPMSRNNLCHFYQVGHSGNLPPFPSPCWPATHKKLLDFLHKARAEGQSYLIVVQASDSVTAVSLLSDLHNKNSLHHLPLEGKGRAGSKCLSFCLYTGSNDKTYMNHIICDHYDAAYGCGKCLDKATMSGQQMSSHFKHCKGLKEKSVGTRKVSDDAAGPSSDTMAGRSRDHPKKKKMETKSREKSPEVLPPTGSMVSPHCSVHTITEKPPTGANEASPKMKSPVRSGKHSSKHGKDRGERPTMRSEKDMPKKDTLSKGTLQKGKTHSKDKTDSDKSRKKKT